MDFDFFLVSLEREPSEYLIDSADVRYQKGILQPLYIVHLKSKQTLTTVPFVAIASHKCTRLRRLRARYL